MKVLVIFWLNSDNFVDVIKRNENKTIEGDLWEYEEEHKNIYNHNTLIGQEIEIEE